MGVKTILIGFLAFAVLALVTIYYFIPFNEINFVSGPVNYNFTTNENLSTIQFYQNMRFQTPDIKYRIEDCNIQKKEEMKSAFDIMENLTILEFNEVPGNENLLITCDEKARFEGGMFIAGEGGPTKIVQSGRYHVILEGKILLIKTFNCNYPNVALHELLHVLGFIHSNNEYNIMYNYTSCRQTISDDIIGLINEVYAEESSPDLLFEDVSARMSGRYIDLNMTIRNFGLADSSSAVIDIKMDNKTIKEIDLGGLEMGTGKTISITSLFVSKIGAGNLQLFIDYKSNELSKENNVFDMNTA